eukprot:CFRG5763T1
MNVLSKLGAGVAGLTAAKECLARNLEVVVFEQNADLGGQWNNTTPRSAVWDEMVMNTSRRNSEFSDYPWEEAISKEESKQYGNGGHAGIFAHNTEALAYLKKYAAHFGVTQNIRFNMNVDKIIRGDGDKGWLVTVTSTKSETRETHFFDRLVVSSGRFRKPQEPFKRSSKSIGVFSGFDGEIVHSGKIRSLDCFSGKRVLVVGSSISGTELASTIGNKAIPAKISHSIRTGRFIINRVSPVNKLSGDSVMYIRLTIWLKRFVGKYMSAALFRRNVMTNFPAQLQAENVPKGLDPNRREVPSLAIASNYVENIYEKKITIVPDIRSANGRTVAFIDGSTDVFDIVVSATGYAVDMDFLPESLRRKIYYKSALTDAEPEPFLYKYTWHLDAPDLAFVGIFKPIGPSWPTTEMQARWVALVWSGELTLPDERKFRQGIEKFKLYRDSPHDEGEFSSQITESIADELGLSPSFLQAIWDPKKYLLGPLFQCQFRSTSRWDSPDIANAAVERWAKYRAEPEFARIQTCTDTFKSGEIGKSTLKHTT